MSKYCINYCLICLAIEIAESALSPVFSSWLNSSVDLNFTFCPLLNESTCPPLSSLSNNSVAILLSNPLSWNRTQIIRLPVNTLSVAVYDYLGNPMHFVLYENYDQNSSYTLSFSTTIPASGYTVVFLVPSYARAYAKFSPLSFDLPLVSSSQNASVTGTMSSATGRLSGILFL